MEGFNSLSDNHHSDVQLNSPQPKKPLTKGTIISVIMVSAIVIITAFLWSWPVYMPSDYPGGEVFHPIVLEVEKNFDENWTVLVTDGSEPVSSILLIIVNPVNETETVVRGLANLTPSNNDPDAVYYDTNDNTKIDAGDILVLKTTGGHILAGYKVMLIRDYISHSLIIGSIKALPA